MTGVWLMLAFLIAYFAHCADDCFAHGDAYDGWVSVGLAAGYAAGVAGVSAVVAWV